MFLQFTLAAALIFSSCAGSQLSKQPYVRIATEKYQTNIEYILNSNKSYVLCIKQDKPTSKVLYPPLAFFVYDLQRNKIVYEESEIIATIRWLNNTQIKVSLIPGVVSGLEESDMKALGFVYDLGLNRKLYENGKDERLR